jgi:hypothetical protein
VLDMQWWRSGYDGQVHAFRTEQASSEFGEALCEHSVPNAKITCTDEGPRCVACLLLLGDLLANTYGDATWRAS